MTLSPSQILAKYLQNEGIVNAYNNATWPGIVDSLPDTPDNLVMINDTNPSPDGRRMDGFYAQHEGIMIRIRATTYPVGWSKGKDIEDALRRVKMTNVTLTVTGGDDRVYRLNVFCRTSGLQKFGQEEKNIRQLFSINGTLSFVRIA